MAVKVLVFHKCKQALSDFWLAKLNQINLFISHLWNMKKLCKRSSNFSPRARNRFFCISDIASFPPLRSQYFQHARVTQSNILLLYLAPSDLYLLIFLPSLHFFPSLCEKKPFFFLPYSTFRQTSGRPLLRKWARKWDRRGGRWRCWEWPAQGHSRPPRGRTQNDLDDASFNALRTFLRSIY